jgi:DNA replication and repair protein RecF
VSPPAERAAAETLPSAHLSRLHLRDFRNFSEQVVEFPPEGVLLVGNNGQGKTNLLEAIYYLEIFRSFRGAPDEQLARFGAEAFWLELRFTDGSGERRLTAGYERRGKRKRVTLDGGEPERLADLLGTIGIAVFAPFDLEIVTGPPAQRRRFLDILLSRVEPGYLQALQRYRQVLARRNALLRGGASEEEVAAWDEGLVRWGSRIVTARALWIGERSATFAAHYARVSGGSAGWMRHETPLVEEGHAATEEGVATAFRQELQRGVERERRRGMTLTGPHRDDLALAMVRPDSAPVDLRTFGSGGQQRTAALALRMLEAETLRDAHGRAPVLLLDDAFAELDPGRTRRILEWIETEGGPAAGQVIVTAPKRSEVEFRQGRLPLWGISAGEIREGGESL